jgi:hypothetical protein
MRLDVHHEWDAIQGPHRLSALMRTRHGTRTITFAHPRPQKQGQRRENLIEVHWDTRVCCKLRQVTSGRPRASTGTLHGRTCVQLESEARDRSHLGRESTRLIKTVCGRHCQPEEVHSKGARAPRPMEQRAGTQQQGENNKTTRLLRGQPRKTGREQRNGTERRDNNAQRHLSRIYMRAQPSPGYVGKVRQAVGGPMPLMRVRTQETRA